MFFSTVLPQCFFCGTISRKGWNAGLNIFDKYVCEDCEGKIVNLSIDDEKYYYYVKRIKDIIKESASA